MPIAQTVTLVFHTRLAQKVTHLENAVALIMSKVNGIMEKMESRDKMDRHMNRDDVSVFYIYILSQRDGQYMLHFPEIY